MKQKIFTLTILLALVVAGGKAFAQSTFDNPTSGATHTYNNTVTSGPWQYFIKSANDTSTTTDLVVAGAGTYTIVSGGSGTGAAASVEITWNNAGAASPDYYLLLRVKGTTSRCPAYRILPIDIQQNTLDFDIWAIGSDIVNPTGWNTTVANDANDCPSYVNAVWSETGYNLDVSYVYYHIQRSGGHNASNWTISLDVTGAGAASVTAFEWMPLGGSYSTFTDGNADNITVTSTTLSPVNDILVRLTVTNGNSDLVLDTEFGTESTSSSGFEVTGNVPDSDYTNVSTDLTIYATPSIGVFSE